MSKKDYENYHEKKNRMKENDYLLPIVTIVLYLGEGHWTGRRKMSQMFRSALEAGKLSEADIYDYEVPLIEADFVNPEDYRTDLQDFFRAMQCRRDRTGLAKLFRTERFQNLAPQTEQIITCEKAGTKMEKEEPPMCEAFEELMEEQRKEGKKEGRIEVERKEIKKVKKKKRFY